MNEPNQPTEHIDPAELDGPVTQAERPEGRHEIIRRAAETRAALTGIINNATERMTATDIIHLLAAQRGVEPTKGFMDSTRYQLDWMAANGLIQKIKPELGGPLAYVKLGTVLDVQLKRRGATKEQLERAAHARKKLAESRARTRELMQQAEATSDELATVASATVQVNQEVELVIAGVTIVVSKNPLTGRPRVVIE